MSFQNILLQMIRHISCPNEFAFYRDKANIEILKSAFCNRDCLGQGFLKNERCDTEKGFPAKQSNMQTMS